MSVTPWVQQVATLVRSRCCETVQPNQVGWRWGIPSSRAVQVSTAGATPEPYVCKRSTCFKRWRPARRHSSSALGQIESPSSSRGRDPPRRYEPKSGSLPAPPAQASCSAFPVAPPPNRPHSDAAVLIRDATGPASVPFRRHSPLLRRPLNENSRSAAFHRPRSRRTVGKSDPLLLPATPTRRRTEIPESPGAEGAR